MLGLPHGASPALVLDAYRRLMKVHHPDRNGGSPESTARAQEIQLAFEELRARPVPEGTLEERLAKLEAELAQREPVQRGPDRVRGARDELDRRARRPRVAHRQVQLMITPG